MEKHSFHGATLGTALNLADPRLWPRWLLMFGLALCTTAAWATFDAAWFARRESPSIALGQAIQLEALHRGRSLVCRRRFVLCLRHLVARAAHGHVPLALGRADHCHRGGTGLPWLLLWRGQGTVPSFVAEGRKTGMSLVGHGFASLVALAQFGVLGLNAVSRQVVQNLELSRY